MRKASLLHLHEEIQKHYSEYEVETSYPLVLFYSEEVLIGFLNTQTGYSQLEIPLSS